MVGRIRIRDGPQVENRCCNPLMFNIWHVCVLLHAPVCNKQSERTLWTRPEAHFLVTRSINNKNPPSQQIRILHKYS